MKEAPAFVWGTQEAKTKHGIRGDPGALRFHWRHETLGLKQALERNPWGLLLFGLAIFALPNLVGDNFSVPEVSARCN